MQMVQQKDKVTILYGNPDHESAVRLNQQHPKVVTPSGMGISVGRYEGDTLIIDTVGVRTDRPFAMLDAYGTPYTKSLHIVERYGCSTTMRQRKAGAGHEENFRLAQGRHRPRLQGQAPAARIHHRGRSSFTTPWSATISMEAARCLGRASVRENPVEQFSQGVRRPQGGETRFLKLPTNRLRSP